MVNEKRLIDANELFEQIKSMSVFVTGLRSGKGVLSEYAKHYRESVLRTVDEAPTVDAVEVVHAHWIYDDDEVDGNLQVHCSNCFAGDVHATWKKNDVPYCWSCGAKMDEDFKGVEIDQFKKED